MAEPTINPYTGRLEKRPAEPKQEGFQGPDPGTVTRQFGPVALREFAQPYSTVAPEAPSTTQPKISLADKAQLGPDELALAAQQKQEGYTPEELGLLKAAMASGGGGGYRAAQVQLPSELEAGAKMGMGALEAEQQAM